LATGATVTGILDEDAMGTDSATQLATQQSIKAYADLKAVQTGTTNNTVTTVTGANAFQGEANLTFNGSTLAVTGAGTFSTSLGVTGTLTTADITTTGTHAITGTLNADYVQIKDNKITTNTSSANLEISANGSGTIDIQNAMTTLGQTVTGDTVVSGAGTFGNVTIGNNYITVTNSNGGLAINPSGNGVVTIGGEYVAIPTSVLVADIFATSEFQLGIGAALVQTITNEDLVLSTNGTGTLRLNNAQTQDTVGAVGAASKLPLDSANEVRPVGYLKLSLDGTTYAVPYFNAS